MKIPNGPSNDRPESRHWRVLALLLICTWVVTACKTQGGSVIPTSTTTTGTYNPPVGVVTDDAFYVRAQITDNYTYITHRDAVSNLDNPTTYTHPGVYDSTYFNTECKVAPGESSAANRDILCFTEADELDLWYWGVQLQYNVPRNMCTYVRISAPYYYNFPVGYGPAGASYTNDNGTISNNYNTIEGVPYCPYDYSASGGPNCCIDSNSNGYSLNVTTISTSVTGGVSTTTTTGSVTTQQWGGNIGSCLGGPATVDPFFPKNKLGIPESVIEYVKTSGLNDLTNVDGPSKQMEGKRDNFFVANYYDDTATVPYAFQPASARIPVGSLISDGNFGKDSGHLGVAGFAGTLITDSTQPYFEYECLDTAFERIARIRLMVRSWDQAGMKGVAAAYADQSGSPNPTYPDDPLHDELIWYDLMNPVVPNGQVDSYYFGFPQYIP